jgi:hypothetical protein
MARKAAEAKRDPFAGLGSYTSRRAEQARAQSGTVTMLPVALIRPDPNQPRRLLPPDLLRALLADELTPVLALRRWLERAEQVVPETGTGRTMHKLRELADSIARHGLINPITIRTPRAGEPIPEGISYFIVTGERRYWAHVLLLAEARQIQEGELVRDPAQIKVTQAAEGVSVRAHQLIENLVREDMNAVERARGLWALRAELSGRPPLDRDGPLDEGDEAEGAPRDVTDRLHDRSPALVPWTQVEELLGISRQHRIRIISVLKLASAAQEMIGDHHLAEMTIRPIVQKLQHDPALQLQVLNQIVTWQQENEAEPGQGRPIVASVQQLVEQVLTPSHSPRVGPPLAAREAVAPVPPSPTASPQLHRLRRAAAAVLRVLDQFERQDQDQLVQALRGLPDNDPLVAQLDELVRRLAQVRGTGR